MAKDVVKKDAETLPAHLAEVSSDIAGLGNSNAAQDNTLPFLAIIQKGSPQINKQEPEYIKGAEVGMLLNTATGELFSGEDGVEVIPCGFTKAFVEWIPRSSGGGYVGTHPFLPETTKRLQVSKNEAGQLVTRDGHQLTETAYTFVLLKGAPVVIGATSTALKPMRDWMSLRNSFYLAGVPAPAFSRVYLARTVYQKNDKGDWYGWRIDDRGWVQDAVAYNRALTIAKAVKAGEIVVGRPDAFMSDASEREDEGIQL